MGFSLQCSQWEAKSSVSEEIYQTLLTMKKLGTYQANLVSHLLEEICLFQRKPASTLIHLFYPYSQQKPYSSGDPVPIKYFGPFFYRSVKTTLLK